jgi:diadenosine tetraphosphate (Ap4A) HIT family hydrolase
MTETIDFLGNKWRFDCMGCAVSGGSMAVPGGMIRRTEHFCVHQDPLIPLPGFVVIASVRHIRSIDEMGVPEYEEFSTLVMKTHRAIKEITRIEHLTLVQEEHAKHFHLWFFPWTESVLQQYGNPSLTKIREIMAAYRGQVIGEAAWTTLKDSIAQIKSLMA